MNKYNIRKVMDENFLHFNSKTTLEASKAFEEQIERGNYMFISIAGAMSTAEIGICLSKMIRKGKIHAIACTGANLEEDIFNLIGKKHYKKIKNWPSLLNKLDSLNYADEVEYQERWGNGIVDKIRTENGV